MTDWIAALLADKPRGWIAEQIMFKVSAWRERGDVGHLGHAEFVERLAREHQPPPGDATQVADGPCSSCGQPWPCPMVRGVWALD